LQQRLALLAPLLAAAVLVAGCSSASGDTAASDGRLQIVTTVAPITSIVSAVAGDAADVRGLVPEGTNSHTFEPPPSAAKTLARADVIFVNGLKLEEPTVDLAEANRKKGSELVELGSRVVTPSGYIYDFSFPKSGGKPNPHLWTDPPMASAYAHVVTETLIRRDPKNEETYQSNYEAFATKVFALIRATRTATATVPPQQRKLLTYHDGYAYFARDFGWTVIGAIQPSSFDEPSPKEVAALIEQIREEKVPAIFGSEVFPSPVLAQIGREAQVRYVDTLRDDDLPGHPGDGSHSYLGLMRFDFVTMVEAMGGDASALKALDVTPAQRDRARYPQ
jgi:ABC-type Zn uptake system ZnuABC Zn-binding protein ZnuA